MKINVTTTHHGLGGAREVWVQVQSNEVYDWPEVFGRLDQTDRDLLIGHKGTNVGKLIPQPSRYYPHVPTKEEQDEHGFLIEDWWVFSEWTVPQ